MILIIFGYQSKEWQKNFYKICTILKLKKIIDDFIFFSNIFEVLKIYNSKIHKIIYVKENYLEQLLKFKIYDNLPSLKTLEILQDKLKFHNFMDNIQLENYCPKLYDKNSKFDIAIVKTRIGECGHGYNIVHQNNESFYTNENLVEEYIKDDKEYVSHIIAKNGIIYSIISYEYKMYNFNYIKSEKQPQIETVPYFLDNEKIKILQKIINKLEYTGICCVNFKIIENTMKIFEINPRIGGSLAGGYFFNDCYSFFYLFCKII